MATGGPHPNKQPSTADSEKTISFHVDKGIIQNLDFQQFIGKLEGSERVAIDLDKYRDVITITGKETAVECSKKQIKARVAKLSINPAVKAEKTHKIPESNAINERQIVELSIARNNFLELFGQQTLQTIREITGDNTVDIIDGRLQLSTDIGVIEKVKSYLEDELHEECIQITIIMKKHLESTNHGRMLQEFLEKYRVGSSLQGSNREDRHLPSHRRRKNTRGQRGRGRGNHDQRGRGRGNHDQRGRGRGNYEQRGRGCGNRGQRGRGGFPVYHSSSNIVVGVTNLNLNTAHANSSQNIFDDFNEDENDIDENAKANDDDNDDSNSETSESDLSVASIRTKDFQETTKQSITITLCSNLKESLSKAIEELRNYSYCSRQWTLAQDEVTFILKQQQRGKPEHNKTYITDRSKQIKRYLVQSVNDYSVHVYVFYYRGIWRVRVNGSKPRVQSAILKMKSYLNDVVEIEVKIPISEAMGFFLRQKASPDIKNLEKKHSIKIILFPPHRKQNDGNHNDHENMNSCLKLLGPVSRVKSAQEELENFLEKLLEREKTFLGDSWDLAKKICARIMPCLNKIQHSDDYEAIGWMKMYSASERRETTPKITFTIVSFDEETMEDVIQQCTDIIEGYDVWKPSADEYRAINKLNKSSLIEDFQKEWDVQLQFDPDANKITIPARSKIIAEEIKEALRNLSKGQRNSEKKITEVIPIPPTIHYFVFQDLRPIFDEAKVQRITIDSKNRHQFKLYGFQKSVIPMKDKIVKMINDIQQRIIKYRFTLSMAESELMRADSYKIPRLIERETKTIIRDVKVDADRSKAKENNEDNNSIITSVANNRAQTVLVQKGNITKAQGVDAIVNAANGTLYCAGGVAKAINEAAGPALDRECQKLIAQNQGAALPTGTAVKTTAGNLPFKSIIHAIGPQYQGGNKQERSLLFRCVLSSLKLAEKEGYKSIALPAISSVTYGFPLKDCTTIVIRAVKQFFADYPQSNMRKVILLDIDDSACNSFARELINDHTKAFDNEIMNYDLPSPLTAKWCWQDQLDEKIYDENHTRQIEDAFKQYLQTNVPSTLKLSIDALNTGKITEYSIHFLSNLKQTLAANANALNTRIECGYQIRVDTGWKRNITRYPLTQQQATKSVDVYRPKPIDTYQLQVIISDVEWDIMSTTREAIQQAETKVREAIKSATVSEQFSVGLNNDIETHKDTIRSIAQQQSIQVDFQQDSGGRVSMRLKGFQQNILQAKLEISQYAQDILTIELDKDDQFSTPTEWGEQEELCKLVELPRNHPDFLRIETCMKATINNIKIEQIQRVQNLRLWNYYVVKRQHIQQKLTHKADLQIEMELFHGTRNTSPCEIYDGEHGFDITFSSQGLWGTGTYFARNASYSCTSYSHLLPNGKRQVFLAQVLTGEAYDYKTQNNQSLRRPPKIEGRVPTAYYDSVTGQTGGSQVYIVYYSDLAYPTFLITFTV